MSNLSKTTRDHDVIRQWAEERGGTPSHVKSTGSSEDVGILRIDFPGYSGEGSLEPISWDDWFEKFDDQGLSLLYEEETAAGERSNFNKLVSAETAAANEEKSGSGGSKRSARRPAKKGSTKKAAPAKSTATKSASKSASGTAAAKTSSSKKSFVKEHWAKEGCSEEGRYQKGCKEGCPG